MAEIGMLFKGRLVNTIQDGTKIQTRRPICRLRKKGYVTEFGRSDTRGYDWHFRDKRSLWNDISDDRLKNEYLQVKVGDLIYVRETWRSWKFSDPHIEYKAGGIAFEGDDLCYTVKESDAELQREWDAGGQVAPRWRPSIHMPKWAARIWLEVTDVRVERIQDIRWSDIRAEGVVCPVHDFDSGFCCSECPDLRETFIESWNSIYTDLGFGWSQNPYVQAITFERTERTD